MGRKKRALLLDARLKRLRITRLRGLPAFAAQPDQELELEGDMVLRLHRAFHAQPLRTVETHHLIARLLHDQAVGACVHALVRKRRPSLGNARRQEHLGVVHGKIRAHREGGPGQISLQPGRPLRIARVALLRSKIYPPHGVEQLRIHLSAVHPRKKAVQRDAVLRHLKVLGTYAHDHSHPTKREGLTRYRVNSKSMMLLPSENMMTRNAMTATTMHKAATPSVTAARDRATASPEAARAKPRRCASVAANGTATPSTTTASQNSGAISPASIRAAEREASW